MRIQIDPAGADILRLGEDNCIGTGSLNFHRELQRKSSQTALIGDSQQHFNLVVLVFVLHKNVFLGWARTRLPAMPFLFFLNLRVNKVCSFAAIARVFRPSPKHTFLPLYELSAPLSAANVQFDGTPAEMLRMICATVFSLNMG